MDISELLAKARQCKSQDELERFIDEACGNDASLRLELLRQLALINADSIPATNTQPFVTSDGAQQVAAQSSARNADIQLTGNDIDVRPGDILANKYKIREEIGRGGIGAVFAADQIAAVERRVAIKVIKAGMDSARVVARFGQERQALALMDHANIARVYDAGLTRLGRPFFAMELVHGLALNRFCDQERLGIRQRIELFVPICLAIQHAHQKGIIHRDLKPANILITLNDGKPTPKIIDFGVAKAIHGGLTEETVYTAHNTMLGTLEYMAPEQARLTNLDIDTRADIYSLGVILYELLCGSLPLSRDHELSGTQEEIVRKIREIEPPKPSTRVSVVNDAGEVAAQRRIDGSKLQRLLRGELDWVVMKCLEKERDRRYDTAEALAADLERYLRDEPVLAAPPSARYRFKKFMRRHWEKAAVVCGVLLLLIVGVIATSMGWARAARAEQLAKDEAAIHRALAEFIENDLFVGVSPNERVWLGLPPDANVQLRTLIDRASQQIKRGQLADQPLVEAALRLTLAKAYGALGSKEQAMEHALRADELRVAHLGPDHPYRLDALEIVGQLQQLSGEIDKAKATFEQVLMGRRQLDGDNALSTLRVRYLLASLERNQSPGEAEPHLRELAEDQQRILGATHEDTLQTRRTLAEVLTAEKRYDEAESLLTETLSAWENVSGKETSGPLNTLNSLAIVYLSKNDLQKCEQSYRILIPRAERVYSPDHPIVAVYKNNLAACLIKEKKYEDSVVLLREIEPIFERLGPKNARTLVMKEQLAYALGVLEKLDDAKSVYASLVPLFLEEYGPNHAKTWGVYRRMAEIQVKQQQPKMAAETLAQLLKAQRERKPIDTAAVGRTTLKLASLLGSIDRANAKALIREVLAELPTDSAERKKLQELLDQINKAQ